MKSLVVNNARPLLKEHRRPVASEHELGVGRHESDLTGQIPVF